jgi:hypothetical protein
MEYKKSIICLVLLEIIIIKVTCVCLNNPQPTTTVAPNIYADPVTNIFTKIEY